MFQYHPVLESQAHDNHVYPMSKRMFVRVKQRFNIKLIGQLLDQIKIQMNDLSLESLNESVKITVSYGQKRSHNTSCITCIPKDFFVFVIGSSVGTSDSHGLKNNCRLRIDLMRQNDDVKTDSSCVAKTGASPKH